MSTAKVAKRVLKEILEKLHFVIYSLAVPVQIHFVIYEKLYTSWNRTITYITKTRLFKYIENFTTKKGIFSDKKILIFHISAQNIDCGYSLEPPRRGGSNEYPQSMFLSRYKK